MRSVVNLLKALMPSFRTISAETQTKIDDGLVEILEFVLAQLNEAPSEEKKVLTINRLKNKLMS